LKTKHICFTKKKYKPATESDAKAATTTIHKNPIEEQQQQKTTQVYEIIQEIGRP
jgi:hypothetical protein